MTDPITRLGSYTTLWEIGVRFKDRTPPMDAHPPIRIRALSEGMALDMIAHYKPELEVIHDEYGNPCIERRATERRA